MPTMASITIKKNDGTTDQVWASKSASAGDNSPAIWRPTGVGANAAESPDFRAVATGNNTVRKIRGVVKYPILQTDVAAGLTTVKGYCQMTVEFITPLHTPAATLNEFASQGVNLLAHTLIKDTVKEGFAPS